MEAPKLADTSVNGNPPVAPDESNLGPTPIVIPVAADSPSTMESTSPAPAPVSWFKFLETAKAEEIRSRFIKEMNSIVAAEGLDHYCSIALLEPDHKITASDLDAVYATLTEENQFHTRNVLLFLLCRGGSIEPAYQISKLCKAFSLHKFIVAVPRQAKSAATLLAIGADEIHMGPLGQLGPIDPQLGGLPALGVSQALRTIACVAEEHPGSAEMLASYLQKVLTVEQIGYCDRISESAVQYAERLLLTKPSLSESAAQIAKLLVHEYKDHGFVIDIEEARRRMGDSWIKSDTREIAAAERLYSLFEHVNLALNLTQDQKMYVMGSTNNARSVRLFKPR